MGVEEDRVDVAVSSSASRAPKLSGASKAAKASAEVWRAFSAEERAPFEERAKVLRIAYEASLKRYLTQEVTAQTVGEAEAPEVPLAAPPPVSLATEARETEVKVRDEDALRTALRDAGA